jgi:predicted DsbA family dithiol-disulfide isomerase
MRSLLTKLALLGVAVMLIAAVYFVRSAADNQDAKKPIAIVAGQPIYEEDILPRIEGELYRLRSEEYEVKSRALEKLINEKLLEAEAKKRNLSREKLLEQEADSKVPVPTDPEVEAIYEAQRARIGRPLADVKEQLRRAIQEARKERARDDYLDRLRAAAEVSIFLRPPKIEVTYDPARFRGPSDAPVVIVEFSDFQCPFCLRAVPTVQAVLDKYGSRVAHAYRDFPLDELHPQARKAAEAAHCAAAQGKFWEYRQLLFDSFGKLDRKTLSAHARAIGLTLPSFDTCLDSGEYADAVQKDYEEGQRLGVNGTPAFFVNGIMLSGAQPASAFEKIINAELATLERKSASR